MRYVHIALAILAMALAILLVLWQVQTIAGEEPQPVVRVPCKVVEVVDGDTVTVELVMRARVRLTDCWADERTTPTGARATRYLQQAALNKQALLEVDLVRLQRLDDAFSFGRILGRIYVDGEDVGRKVVRSGYARAQKEK